MGCWWRRLVPRRTATYKVLPRRCLPHIPPSLLPSSSSHFLISSTPATPGVRFTQHQDSQRSPGPQVVHPVSSSTLPRRNDTTAVLCVGMPPRGGSGAVCASVEDLCDLVCFPAFFYCYVRLLAWYLGPRSTLVSPSSCASWSLCPLASLVKTATTL